ncbi:MAG: DUF2071 domain-containing protein [Chloroflexi bacterium]|nr:DUF2071 domain-containing protein [Chloroflexota bacterium]
MPDLPRAPHIPGVFLSADWRFLTMINYEVDPAHLRPFVPRGTELDYWEGRSFLSLVGFMFLRTRLLGWSIPFHQNFEEINLRFYVRRRGPEGWRRGVVFIREIVPRRAIAAVARLVYNEPYLARQMRHRLDLHGGLMAPKGVASFGWHDRGQWQSMSVRTIGGPQTPDAGSQEEFISEHYWGYTAQRDGGAVEYRVEHPQWRLWRVSDATFAGDAAPVYPPQLVKYLTTVPRSAFVAEGSPVVVRWGERV